MRLKKVLRETNTITYVLAKSTISYGLNLIELVSPPPEATTYLLSGSVGAVFPRKL